MKKILSYLLFFVAALLFVPSANGFVIDVKPKRENVESSKKEFSKKHSKKQLRKLKRKERKRERLEKRLKKFQKKWEMKAQKHSLKKQKKRRRFFGGVTDEPKFQLGMILVLAAILVGVLSALPLLGGLFGLISGIAALIGIILMIWAAAEYY